MQTLADIPRKWASLTPDRKCMVCYSDDVGKVYLETI